MNLCHICYTNNLININCENKTCSSIICEDCFEIYLNFCETENKLCKCVNDNCLSYYISTSIPQKFRDKYQSVTKNGLLHSNKDEVVNRVNWESMITKIRNEKLEYISKFPPAVALTAKIALGAKLKKISEHNKTKMKNLVNNLNRLCMISHCSGKLDENFICIKCLTRFCKKCEKIVKENHVCDDNDIKSLSILSDIRKCPGCGIIIQRSEGCDHMTCAVCKCNFIYSTGELSNHGSHNKSVPEPKKKFTFDFKSKLGVEIANKLYRIESKEPKEPNLTTLNNAIYKFHTKNDDSTIIRVFERYIKDQAIYSSYMKLMNEITETYMAEKLDLEYLDEIIENNNL